AGALTAGAAFAAHTRPASPARAAAPASDCGSSDSLLGSLTGILCPVTSSAGGAVSSLLGGNGGSGYGDSGGSEGGADMRGRTHASVGDRRGGAGAPGDKSGSSYDGGSSARAGVHGGWASRSTNSADHGAQSDSRRRTVTSDAGGSRRTGAYGSGPFHGAATPYGPGGGNAPGIRGTARSGDTAGRAAAQLGRLGRGSGRQPARRARTNRLGPAAHRAQAPSVQGTGAQGPGVSASGQRAGNSAGTWQPGVAGQVPRLVGGQVGGQVGASARRTAGAAPAGAARPGTARAGAARAGAGHAGAVPGSTGARSAARTLPWQPLGQFRAKLGLGQPAGPGAAPAQSPGRAGALNGGRALATTPAARGRSGPGTLPAIAVIVAAGIAALAVAWLRRRHDAGRHCQL
ncbi:MAG TPA: hypothetical protein VKD26_06430, partial [Streptosporangiaceae bacterium]|nr:hypothetical protein [Streptosporangiaceae bacterium]